MRHFASVTCPKLALTLSDYSNKGYCTGFALAEPKRPGGPEVPAQCASYLDDKIKFSQ